MLFPINRWGILQHRWGQVGGRRVCKWIITNSYFKRLISKHLQLLVELLAEMFVFSSSDNCHHRGVRKYCLGWTAGDTTLDRILWHRCNIWNDIPLCYMWLVPLSSQQVSDLDNRGKNKHLFMLRTVFNYIYPTMIIVTLKHIVF